MQFGCPSLRPGISSSPRVTTCSYYGLSDVSERGHAVKNVLVTELYSTTVLRYFYFT